jgi:hypothetical protein
MESYKGIDYGLGQSNIDLETGIRYGVISQHSLDPEASNEIFIEGAVYLPYCPHCNEANDADSSAESCHNCGKDVGEWEYADEPTYVEYHEQTPDGEIIIIDCLDTDYMIIKSPYVTKGNYCSPCVPGAIDLDHTDPKGHQAYCLPDDFFEEKAPYTYSIRKGE